MQHSINSLIVEDSRLFRGILSELMDRHNFKHSACASGSEALEMVNKQPVDLVCAAYHLSDMNGEMLSRQLRSLRNSHNTRIILFTSEDNEDLLKQALLAGATDIYTKQQFHLFETYIERLAKNLSTQIIGQVLLIEDSPSQLLWMESLLLERGLEVDSFSNAEQALTAFNNNHYDLVISDIVLEGNMSGLTLVREIRRHSSDKGLTPVFAISAHDDSSRRIELYHVGVNDYMTKPIIVEELFYRIANLIDNHNIINELHLERQHLKEIALLDPLTGLYNRNAFNKLVPRELAVAKRGNRPISLAILDLDYFKKINDQFGHSIGDKVLADVGLWLRKTLRKGDMVFRWGGEEFVILMINCPPNKAKQALEKQRERFNKRKYGTLSITASIGISGIDAFIHPPDVDSLFNQADEAVYKAKLMGRNRICLFQ